MNQTAPKILPEELHLVGINVFKSLLETSEEFMDNPQKVKAFDFGVSKNIAYNLNKEMMRYRLHFIVDAHNDDQSPLGLKAEYGIEFHFKIDNLNNFVRLKNGDEIETHIGLAATLFAIAYSTSRGIVLERMQGTYFDGVILPIIDPYKVMQEDKIVPAQK